MVQLAHIFKKDKDKDRAKDKPEKPDSSASSTARPPSTADDFPDPPPLSPRPSFSKSPTKPKSPSKSSSKSPSKSPTKSSSPTKNRFSHSRSSSSTSTQNAPSFKFARSSRDQDLHPLNLPPDELRRRLSAMAASRDDQPSSMDIDPQEPQLKQNGTNGTEERSPTPPPHKSSGSTDEADSFKLAGNKFFKDGDYRRAIEEYNKGMLFHPNFSIRSP